MNHTRSADDVRCPAPKIAADLKAYADHELTVLRRRTVAYHLRRCAACRTEIAAMTSIASDIKASDAGSAATLNPDLRQRLLERMGTETPSVPTARTLPLWRRKPLLVFGGGAVYTAVFLLLVAILLPTFSTVREKARQGRAVPFVGQIDTAGKDPEAVHVFLPDKMADGKVPPDFSTVSGQINENDLNGADGKRTLSKPDRHSDRRYLPPGFSLLKEGIASNSNQYDKYKEMGWNGYDKLESANQLNRLNQLDQLLTERQVHREGSVTVAVDKLEAASDKVEQMVKASGGFVASNNLATDSDGFKSADFSVRVPVEQFDAMLRQFAGLGTVTAKSVSGEDITERVSDSTQAEQVLKDAARMAARKLKNENGSEKEIHYREADLRGVKIELAQTQARLRLLRKMARLSTINVSLTEKAKRAAQTPTQSGFLGDLSATNRMASAAFVSAIRVPVVLIIWVLAFCPLWVPMLVFYRFASGRGALSR